MLEENKKITTKKQKDFKKVLEDSKVRIPQVGDTITGTVLSASKSDVRLDIDGILTGVVRGQELYFEVDEYANLQPGDKIEAMVIEEENENGELELSFKYAGHEKTWLTLTDAYDKRKPIKVKVIDANKGGLLMKYGQVDGFLPVSQLAPENYPRVNGGDKGKILEKLKGFVGQELEARIMTLDRKDEKLIVSEKEAWNEKQKDIIAKYKVGSVVEGRITAVTDFGVFITFGENLEGLIHISELAWQRIDNPHDLFKVGDIIKAEIISAEGPKIFLSAKRLVDDPWKDVHKKYKVGQNIKGTILKVNPFGLFVKLDNEIHGLAHISQLGLVLGQKVQDLFKTGDKIDFTISSIEPKEHRLGLTVTKKKIDLSSQEIVDKKDKEGVKKKEEKKGKAQKEKKAVKITEKDKTFSNVQLADSTSGKAVIDEPEDKKKEKDKKDKKTKSSKPSSLTAGR